MRIEQHPNHISIPRHPAPEEVRAYMDFLSKEHPLLLEAITRAAEAPLVNAENAPVPQALSDTQALPTPPTIDSPIST